MKKNLHDSISAFLIQTYYLLFFKHITSCFRLHKASNLNKELVVCVNFIDKMSENNNELMPNKNISAETVKAEDVVKIKANKSF